jgi:hypothetical protein
MPAFDFPTVMAGRRPGHPCLDALEQKDVDARHKAGHDDYN